MRMKSEKETLIAKKLFNRYFTKEEMVELGKKHNIEHPNKPIDIKLYNNPNLSHWEAKEIFIDEIFKAKGGRIDKNYQNIKMNWMITAFNEASYQNKSNEWNGFQTFDDTVNYLYKKVKELAKICGVQIELKYSDPTLYSSEYIEIKDNKTAQSILKNICSEASKGKEQYDNQINIADIPTIEENGVKKEDINANINIETPIQYDHVI